MNIPLILEKQLAELHGTLANINKKHDRQSLLDKKIPEIINLINFYIICVKQKDIESDEYKKNLSSILHLFISNLIELIKNYPGCNLPIAEIQYVVRCLVVFGANSSDTKQMLHMESNENVSNKLKPIKQDLNIIVPYSNEVKQRYLQKNQQTFKDDLLEKKEMIFDIIYIFGMEGFELLYAHFLKDTDNKQDLLKKIMLGLLKVNQNEKIDSKREAITLTFFECISKKEKKLLANKLSEQLENFLLYCLAFYSDNEGFIIKMIPHTIKDIKALVKYIPVEKPRNERLARAWQNQKITPFHLALGRGFARVAALFLTQGIYSYWLNLTETPHPLKAIADTYTYCFFKSAEDFVELLKIAAPYYSKEKDASYLERLQIALFVHQDDLQTCLHVLRKLFEANFFSRLTDRSLWPLESRKEISVKANIGVSLVNPQIPFETGTALIKVMWEKKLVSQDDVSFLMQAFNVKHQKFMRFFIEEIPRLEQMVELISLQQQIQAKLSIFEFIEEIDGLTDLASICDDLLKEKKGAVLKKIPASYLKKIAIRKPTKAIQFLRGKVSSQSETDTDLSLLQLAIYYNDLDAVKLFCEEKEFYITETEINNALIQGASNEIVKYLWDRSGIILKDQLEIYATPFMFAICFKNVDLIQMFFSKSVQQEQKFINPRLIIEAVYTDQQELAVSILKEFDLIPYLKAGIAEKNDDEKFSVWKSELEQWMLCVLFLKSYELLHKLLQNACNELSDIKQLLQGVFTSHLPSLILAFVTRLQYGSDYDYNTDVRPNIAPRGFIGELRTLKFYCDENNKSKLTDGLLKILDLLLELKADIDAEVYIFGSWSTPLMLACAANLSEVVEKLLQHGARTDSTISEHAFSYAVRKNFIECAKNLLAHGANAWVTSNEGYTALDYAVLNNNTTSVSLILDTLKDADPEAADKYMIQSYKILQPHQTELRALLESKIINKILLEKLHNKNANQQNYSIVLETVEQTVNPTNSPKPTNTPDPSEPAGAINSSKWFKFYDNGKLCYSRMDKRTWNTLQERNTEKFFIDTLRKNEEEKHAFGPRMKKIKEGCFKLRPTGDSRIFFKKNPETVSLIGSEPGPVYDAYLAQKGHEKKLRFV